MSIVFEIPNFTAFFSDGLLLLSFAKPGVQNPSILPGDLQRKKTQQEWYGRNLASRHPLDWCCNRRWIENNNHKDDVDSNQIIAQLWLRKRYRRWAIK
ncbi:hypothetical protein ACTXT7_011748 [Hymenolepis weldensis]